MAINDPAKTMLRYILSRSLAAIPLLWLAITALFVVFLSVVRQLSDRIAVMYRGGIVELARTDLLFSQPHMNTRASCCPRLRPSSR